MTVKGGTTPACAVCKYQRRKCSPTCPLAPYFPANQPKMFQNVHRLYGVSNITKILESLDTDDQKEDAMKSIIYEAEMRQRFPVHGCSMIICQLRSQLHCAVEELRCVYEQIDACKEQLSSSNSNRLSFDYGPSVLDVGPSFQIPEPTYGVDPAYGSFFGPFHDEMATTNNHHHLTAIQAIQAQMNTFGIQQEEKHDIFFQDYKGTDDRKAGFDLRYDRKVELDTRYDRKAECDSSTSESSINETTTTTTRNISKSELKNAAAGFSLTTMR